MPRSADERGNFISEWFGHRVYPAVVASQQTLADQSGQICPFLSSVKGAQQGCVKQAASRGVCTISSSSNGPRQDWVVCPYRAFDQGFFKTIVSRLYSEQEGRLAIFPAPNIGSASVQTEIRRLVDAGRTVLVYFDVKIGGEISLSPTSQSPEMAFDVTFVSIKKAKSSYALGRFAIVEIQTMDFHGSYKKAVQNLEHGLRLHRQQFPPVLQDNLHWLGEGIEGPNIANVFKRTFYQMMFKFSFGKNESCAGTALAIPAAVWDSWQRFLGGPDLIKSKDGTFRLRAPGQSLPTKKVPAWIYVFDIDAKDKGTPSRMRIERVIAASSEALAYYALQKAPSAASTHLMSQEGIYSTLRRRLLDYWPDLPI